MDHAQARESVIEAARGWILTPFHMNACLKGAGVDCGRFIAAVYEEAGVLPHYEVEQIPGDWYQHTDDEWYIRTVLRVLREVDAPGPGDTALFKIGRVYGHAALVTAWPEVIHVCRTGARVELADAAHAPLAKKPVRFFSPWTE